MASVSSRREYSGYVHSLSEAIGKSFTLPEGSLDIKSSGAVTAHLYEKYGTIYYVSCVFALDGTIVIIKKVNANIPRATPEPIKMAFTVESLGFGGEGISAVLFWIELSDWP